MHRVWQSPALQISNENEESIGDCIVSEAKEERAVDRGITTPAREKVRTDLRPRVTGSLHKSVGLLLDVDSILNALITAPPYHIRTNLLRLEGFHKILWRNMKR